MSKSIKNRNHAVNRIAAAVSKISSFSRFKRVFITAKNGMLNVFDNCGEQNFEQTKMS